MEYHPVVIIGAGSTGVAAAVSLKDRGVRPLVLDRADEVASSWRERYDGLKLNTGRPFSQLPDRKYPKGTPMFPSRDEVIEYVDRHAHEDGIDLRLGTKVDRIEQNPPGWRIRTSDGDLDAREVVVASGYLAVPVIPPWPGRDTFTGEIVHSAEYRNAQTYRDKRVLVVGGGSSAMEIAHEVATGGAAQVWMAIRTPPNMLLRSLPGGLSGDLIAIPLLHVPIRLADAVARFGRRRSIGNLSEFGLPVPAEGVFSRQARIGQAPAVVDMEVIDAIRDRRIEIVPAVESFDQTSVALAGGKRVEPDAVICATGFRCGLEPMVGHLGVLNDDGVPRVTGAKPAAPGLRFIGYIPRPAALGYFAKQAKRAAKQIAAELGNR